LHLGKWRRGRNCNYQLFHESAQGEAVGQEERGQGVAVEGVSEEAGGKDKDKDKDKEEDWLGLDGLKCATNTRLPCKSGSSVPEGFAVTNADSYYPFPNATIAGFSILKLKHPEAAALIDELLRWISDPAGGFTLADCPSSIKVINSWFPKLDKA
jgi:hypothetical protein